jgi:proline dehydrogenase
MLARSFKRQAFATSLYSRRCYTARERSAARSVRGLRTSAVGGGALTATLILGWGYSLYADTPPLPREHEPAPTPLSQLLRSYVVYSMCSIPGIVDASPALLSFCTSVPGLRQLTEAFVRATFFAQVRSRSSDEVDRRIEHRKCRTQFVGGDTAHACLPLIRRLRAEDKGTLLAYSVEVDENGAADGARSTGEPVHKHIVQEMIRAIDVAGDFEDSRAHEIIGSGRRTWVAVKLVSFSYHRN